MPVDICQPPAGKPSLTRTTGASSFDIFRGKTDPPYATPFATRVYNDSVVTDRNPFVEAAHDIDDNNQYIKPSRSNRPVNPAFARGASHIKFGAGMTPQETEASLKRRPGSECRYRDMAGHHIFDGPVKGNGGGDGSDITGCCPKRPVSNSKFQELSGHNVFAFIDTPLPPPPPPSREPYMPKERVIPPHTCPRNPKKNESHMQIGGPVCVVSEELKRPSTCPSPSTYDVLYCGGGNDVITRARQVEEAKMRAFQGNHIFDFNDEPRNEAEDEEHFSISKMARRRDIRGNDIFGEGRRDNRPWSLRPAPPSCGKRHIGPCSQKTFIVDPQALRVNDSSQYLTTCEPNSCKG